MSEPEHEPTRMRWTDDAIAAAGDLAARFGAKEAARQIGVSPGALYNALRSNGVSIIKVRWSDAALRRAIATAVRHGVAASGREMGLSQDGMQAALASRGISVRRLRRAALQIRAERA